MSARKSSSISRRLTALASLLTAGGLAGCVDYTEHRDTVTLRAGDAQAWNKVVHIADPWPPYVMNTRIPGDGKRTAVVIQRYSTGDGNAGAAQGLAPAGDAAAGAANGAAR